MAMKFRCFFFILTLILATDLKSQTSITRVVSIEPHMSFQNYEHFKRLTLSSTDSELEYLEGFDFEWGYRYKLNINESKLAESLSDGTRYEYSLNHIVSKIKVPDTSEFKLFLDPNRYYYELEGEEANMNSTFKQLNDSTYLYFEQVKIEVPDHLRHDLKNMISRKQSKVGRFQYLNSKRILLIGL